MELYTLDSLLRRIDVIDTYVSLIWTERWRAWGDFELLVQSTPKNRKMLVEGVQLASNESNYVMEVETLEDSVNTDGTALLKVKGRSLEATFDDRMAIDGLSVDLATEPKWVITGDPMSIALGVVTNICYTGTLDAGDVIPWLSFGGLYPPDTIPHPTDIVTYGFEPKTVYAFLVEICNLYFFGFRLNRPATSAGTLYFDLYTGSDRTSHQTDYPAVIFSLGLENLQNTTELKSSATYKNVAYVISPVGHRVVYSPDADSTVAGFQRKVMFVQADDITDTDSTVAAAKMDQRGLAELAKNRRISAFDGEINQNSKYKYGTDYRLGDLVEQQNRDGVMNEMRVTEQIFISDSTGDRSYPTLELNQFVTPGSWAALPPDKVWADYGPADYWADQ